MFCFKRILYIIRIYITTYGRQALLPCQQTQRNIEPKTTNDLVEVISS